MVNVEKNIHEAILQIVQQKSLQIDKIDNDQRLVSDLGLESLDIAQLVAILEIDLDVDPFATTVPISSIRTVGDLCRAYASCFQSGFPTDV